MSSPVRVPVPPTAQLSDNLPFAAADAAAVFAPASYSADASSDKAAADAELAAADAEPEAYAAALSAADCALSALP